MRSEVHTRRAVLLIRWHIPCDVRRAAPTGLPLHRYWCAPMVPILISPLSAVAAVSTCLRHDETVAAYQLQRHLKSVQQSRTGFDPNRNPFTLPRHRKPSQRRRHCQDTVMAVMCARCAPRCAPVRSFGQKARIFKRAPTAPLVPQSLSRIHAAQKLCRVQRCVGRISNAHIVGDDRRVSVRDVREWAGVHKHRRPFDRLHCGA